MIVSIDGYKHAIKGGYVCIGGVNRKIMRIVAGVGGGNRLVWEAEATVIPTEKVIYCGTLYSGQDYAF